MQYKKQKRKHGKKRSLTARVSEVHIPGNYHWKMLRLLATDLRQHLYCYEYETFLEISRCRDFDLYILLAEAWGPQSIYLAERPLDEYRAVYQLTTLLKKFVFPESTVDVRAVATKKFLAAESSCGDFNREGYTRMIFGLTDRDINNITYVRNFLRKLLGLSPPGDEKLTEWSRHGPGANLDTVAGNISTYNKYAEWPYSCTSLAFPYAVFAIQSDQRWHNALLIDYCRTKNICRDDVDKSRFWHDVIRIVPGNKITFVPKDARTERTIAIEPAMNLYLQLGIDGYIRRRLKRWGIDIDDQSKNQRMARFGSFDGSYATLDLSAASDSISLKICEMLLPKDWYDLLIKLRSPCGKLGEETISFEKISSMGNGYTFALETAIFAAIVYAAMKTVRGRYDHKECAIYGDDIIVPTDCAQEVIHLLNLSGFKLNLEKSFTTGRFRESCGADWLDGKPVRPILVKTAPSNIMGLFNDYNRLRRYLLLRFIHNESESHLLRWLRGLIPKDFTRYVGPCSDESFDSYIHTEYPPFGAYKGWVYRYQQLVVRPVDRRGKNLHFRKLMASLRPVNISLNSKWNFHFWRGVKLTDSGGAFTVYKRNFVEVLQTKPRTSFWCAEYTE